MPCGQPLAVVTIQRGLTPGTDKEIIKYVFNHVQFEKKMVRLCPPDPTVFSWGGKPLQDLTGSVKYSIQYIPL